MSQRTISIFFLCAWVLILGLCIVSWIAGKEPSWIITIMPIILVITFYAEKIIMEGKEK